MKLNSVLTLLFIALFTACKGGAYDLSGYGLKPDTGENASPLIAKALQEIAAEVNFMATFATVGERKVITSAPITPPQKEANMAMESALPA